MDAMHSRGATPPPFPALHEQLLQLLKQQVALEERLVMQRALMQRISEGFTVLRAWAVRSAQHDVSLHDLLVVSAYSSELAGPIEKTMVEPGTVEMNEVMVQRRRADDYAEKSAPVAESRSAHRGDPLEQQQCEAKRAYGAFIRARVMDEACAEPDSTTQFHTLTADSFYLLLPYLAELLRELANTSSAGSLVQSSATTECGTTAAAAADLPPTLPPAAAGVAWCASSTRAVRFLELGLKHFPEVLESSEFRPHLLESLACLQESNNRSSAALQLCHRANVLWTNLHHLGVVDATNISSHHDDGY